MPEQVNHSTSPINATGIDRTEGLARAMNNPGLYHRLLESFYRSYSASASRISELISAGEIAEAGHLVHAVKGAGATIGAKGLATAAGQLEKACRTDGINAGVVPQELLDTFCQQLAEVLSSIRPGGITGPGD